MPIDTVYIVNPASSAGRTGRRWPAIEASLREVGLTVEARLTSRPREATELARAALAGGAGRLVAVGGDGTLNEVVNGCFSPTGEPLVDRPVVGLLPSGTGGDFRRTVGIPAGARAAAAVLAAGHTRPVDCGRIDYASAATPPRHFINIADCGVGGEVAARVNRSRRLAGGSATFLYHSVAALLAFQPRPVRVEVDGTSVVGSAQNVVIANGSHFGGGMRVAPAARVDDGLFDVVLIGDASKLRTLLEVRRVYDGSHIGRPGVSWRRGAEVTVTPLDHRALLFDVDGEQVGRAPATLRCLRGALRFCAPETT